MGKIKNLRDKTTKVFKEEGMSAVLKKGTRFTARKMLQWINGAQPSGPSDTFADVLFINGCYLPHPSRYRVAHQREQLWAADVSSNKVFYSDITLDMVRMYRVFVFFRCPFTDEIGEFIAKAKECNKVVLYDIDDLMIDISYTKTIKHIDEMPEADRKIYYDGIERNQKVLRMCDGAITTTERMAEELQKYVPKVYINRNVASEEMLMLSEKAYKEKKTDGNIRLGYFSGSITHNADFELIQPVIVRLMERYENLILVLCGEIDLPKELRPFSKRIEVTPFCDWKELPNRIANVDINLAPLEESIFNEAKSENKWVEAALVRVPTVASDVGAFHMMITSGENGILCKTEQDWENALIALIEDEGKRLALANSAFLYCKQNCTSVYTAAKFGAYIRSIMKPNIVFVLPVLQISGGALVILKHCAMMKEAGYDVAILNQGDEKEKWVEKDGNLLPVISYKETSIAASIDKAVATLWSTVSFLEIYGKIKQRYYNVQNFETDFYESGDDLKIGANRTYCSNLDMKYITISKWCEDWLQDKYGKRAVYAPNGIYLERFYPERRNWKGRKVRILVEGNSNDYYKNVDESFKIIDLLDKNKYEIWFMSYQGKPKDNYYVDKFLHKVPYEEVPDIYRQCDILIKSSILESFSYPPLEMMATGGYVVVAPNGGNIEYLRDGENCLFYDHNNLDSAVNAIERILEDTALQIKMYENGIKTAKERDWNSINLDILNLYDVNTETIQDK